jgi:hypothetical protein
MALLLFLNLLTLVFVIGSYVLEAENGAIISYTSMATALFYMFFTNLIILLYTDVYRVALVKLLRVDRWLARRGTIVIGERS